MVVCRWRRRRGTSEVGGLRRPAAVALGPPREVDVLALGAGPVAGIGGGRGTWGPAEASCSPSCCCSSGCSYSSCCCSSCCCSSSCCSSGGVLLRGGTAVVAGAAAATALLILLLPRALLRREVLRARHSQGDRSCCCCSCSCCCCSYSWLVERLRWRLRLLVVSLLLVLLVLLIGAMRRRRKPVLIGSVLVVVAGIRLRRVGRSRSRGSRGRSSSCCCYCHGRLEPDGRGRHERRGGVLWGRRARAAASVVVSEFVIVVGFAFFVLFVIVALVFTDLLGRLFDVSFAVDERRQPCAVRSERGALSRPLPERGRADRGGLERRRRRRGGRILLIWVNCPSERRRK